MYDSSHAFGYNDSSAYGHYGTYGAAVEASSGKIGPTKSLFARTGLRGRINAAAILLSLIVPWALFTINFALLSQEVHFNNAEVVDTVVAVSAVLLFLSGLALFAVRRGPEREPSVAVFILVSAAVAWILAVALGEVNFKAYMHPYEQFLHMRSYKDVDPLKMRGQQLMDAGSIRFLNTSTVDVSKSMGFKNKDVFCVAPISDGSTASTYDFWAVGVNCCNDRTSTGAFRFECISSGGIKLHAGLRWISAEERPFFRLAVQQAEAIHNITAVHPLFFTMVKDADAAVESLKGSATQNTILGIIGFFILQSFLVVIGVLLATKMAV